MICLLFSDNFISDGSSLLFNFIKRCEFNPSNLNEVNINGVTPLTAAIESEQEEITVELLSKQVNPLIENIHGNSPVKLASINPWFRNIIDQAIELRTCKQLYCMVGQKISYLHKNYQINKIIQGGACSLITMEIEDLENSQIYFAKIKPYFGGFELRNYISLDQYIDLFQIKKIILNDAESNSNIYRKVYCLVQKYVPGKNLSNTFEHLTTNAERALVVRAAIKALCQLHQQGYVHNDALPDNCLWDPINQIAHFIDYDIMRKFTDFKKPQDPDFLMEKKLLDLERLIIGEALFAPEKQILGLEDYVDNMEEILEEIEDLSITDAFKEQLLQKISRKNVIYTHNSDPDRLKMKFSINL